MTISAIIDGQLVSPAEEVLAGTMTIAQADDVFRHAKGSCPDCEAWMASLDPFQGGSLYQALQVADRSVSYRRGSYFNGDDGTRQIRRVMCFCHVSGYRKGVGGNSPCSQSDDIHNAVVNVIAAHYRRTLGDGFTVKTELKLTFPGEKGRDYRPDIAIRKQSGAFDTCIEYQRSPEAFEHFKARHTTREQQWPSVLWFFDRCIYNKPSTIKARNWLFERQLVFFECWIDSNTGELRIEPGDSAADIKPSPRRSALPTFCSESSIIQAAEAASMPKKPLELRIKGESLAWQIKDAQAQMVAKYAEVAEQRRREHEELLRRSAWRQLQTTIRDVSILGAVAASKATESWTAEQLDAERHRLDQFREAADAERSRQRQLRLQREAEEQAARAQQQQRDKEEAIALVTQILSLRELAQREYALSVWSRVTASMSLSFLRSEVARLQSCIAEAEKERQRVEEQKAARVRLGQLQQLRETVRTLFEWGEAEKVRQAIRDFGLRSDENAAFWDLFPGPSIRLWLAEVLTEGEDAA